MDPNANLKEQLRLANDLANAEVTLNIEQSHKAMRLAELVTALDEWIKKGGFLPKEWEPVGAYRMIEVDATDLFGNENVNWRYCVAHATFAHKEACEFIIHISEEQEYREDEVEKMREFGCTEEFVKAFEDAAAKGALKVLFYA